MYHNVTIIDLNLTILCIVIPFYDIVYFFKIIKHESRKYFLRPAKN